MRYGLTMWGVSRGFCRHVGRLSCALVLISGFVTEISGQVVINEVIADNTDVEPLDADGNTTDMIELYNTSEEETVILGTGDPLTSYCLGDRDNLVDEDPWCFPAGIEIGPQSSIVVFCDGDLEKECELHADFRIGAGGTEPISLWGPRGSELQRPLVDQIFLPPLSENVSFGRSPDGAGVAPVPIDETFNVFNFFQPGQATFGTCTEGEVGTCGFFGRFRSCTGATNSTPENAAPRITRVNLTEINNSPAIDEAILFVLRVRDDQEPSAANLPRAEIQYSVNGAEQAPIALTFMGLEDNGSPLDRSSLWEATIPAQPAGARVEFQFVVEDAQGGVGTNPSNLCDPGQGPCNRIGLPGPNCVRDPANADEFLSCDVRYRYQSGYEPQGVLANLVINEVLARQSSVIADPTESSCPDTAPNCQFDDVIELYNGAAESIDLSGMWLSNRRLEPQLWQFPAGSSIAAGEYLLVWTDNDGGKCPRPLEDKPGDGQECPDPTDPAMGAYHTDFTLTGDGDQIYLYDRAENGFGVIHSVEFGAQEIDQSFALKPDGCRFGLFEVRLPEEATLGLANPGVAECSDEPPQFLRGDANNDCGVDLADGIFILNALFKGEGPISCRDAGDTNDDTKVDLSDAIFLLNFLFVENTPIPPAPGAETQGVDPTPDDLGFCIQNDCSSG